MHAGLPDENGHYHETPQSLALKLASFAEKGWINMAGGCCGTTPEHIRALAEVLKDYAQDLSFTPMVRSFPG